MDIHSRRSRRRARILAALLGTCCVAFIAPVPAGTAPELRTSSATSGGAAATSGRFRLDSALAVPPLGTASGGTYRVTLGIVLPAIHDAGTQPPDALFAHGFEN